MLKEVITCTKDLLLTKCWEVSLKGLFEMRTLLKFTFGYLLKSKKNNKEGTHGQEPMKSFKLGSLMQEHRLKRVKSFMTSQGQKNY